jgi:hypothetical protein
MRNAIRGSRLSAKDNSGTYLDMLSIIYKQVTYDLGSNFDSPLWRNFMDVRVPTYTCNDTCIALSGRVQRHL